MKLLKKILSVFIGILGLYYFFSRVDFSKITLFELKDLYNPYLLLLSIILYLFSHFFRALRLFFILNNQHLKFRKILSTQFVSNGVNLILPFKLGEAYRIYHFSKINKKSTETVIFLVFERLFDFVFLLLLFGLIVFFEPTYFKSINHFPSLLGILLLLVIVSSLIAKESLSFIHLKLLNFTTNNKIKLEIFKLTGELLRVIESFQLNIKSKFINIISYTILIWSLEFFSLFIFYDQIGGQLDLILLLLIFISFSSFLPNGPLGLGGIQLAFYSIYSIINPLFEDYLILGISYSLFIFGSGIILAFILKTFQKNS